MCVGSVQCEQHQFASDNLCLGQYQCNPRARNGWQEAGQWDERMFFIGCSCLSKNQEVRLWAHKTSFQTSSRFGCVPHRVNHSMLASCGASCCKTPISYKRAGRRPCPRQGGADVKAKKTSELGLQFGPAPKSDSL